MLIAVISAVLLLILLLPIRLAVTAIYYGRTLWTTMQVYCSKLLDDTAIFDRDLLRISGTHNTEVRYKDIRLPKGDPTLLLKSLKLRRVGVYALLSNRVGSVMTAVLAGTVGNIVTDIAKDKCRIMINRGNMPNSKYGIEVVVTTCVLRILFNLIKEIFNGKSQ